MNLIFLDWVKNLKFAKINKDKFVISDAFKEKLKALEKLLGFKISNHEYYLKALTHRSYIEISQDNIKSNERLEFLGDSILGLIVAEYLFMNNKNQDEGYLTKTRAHLVNKEALTKAANLLGIEDFLFFDERYVRGSQKGLDTINADAMEALIGAIYIDKGLKIAAKFVVRWMIDPILKDQNFIPDKNYKGQLLEYAHAHKMLPPSYNLIKEEGPEHKKTFTIEVLIDNVSYGISNGNNKKATEQQAAKIAIENFKGFEN